MLKNINSNMVVVAVEDTYTDQSLIRELVAKFRKWFAAFRRTRIEESNAQTIAALGEFDREFEAKYLTPGGPQDVVSNIKTKALYDFNIIM